MVFLWFLTALALPLQEPAETFEPIHPGNHIQYGPFTVTVPDGAYLTPEEFTPLMFPLLEQEYIPNCVGVLFSSSSEWTYGVTIQLIPKESFTITPSLDPAVWRELFTKQHLLTSQPLSGEGVVMTLPPNWQPDKASFGIGLSYPSGEEGKESEVVAKKVWVSSEGALIYSLKTTESAFDTHYEVISRIMDSVVVSPDAMPVMKDGVHSYLTLFGLEAQVIPTQDPPEGPDPKVTRLSIAIGVVGLVLLAVVILIKKRDQGDAGV